jgi:hypothetical protein
MEQDTPLHIRMHAEPVVLNFSAPSFHIWATQYYACRQTFVGPNPGFSPVPYFLLCRAIELELKSRHLEKKRQHQVRATFRHRIRSAYLALPRRQQTLSPAELAVLKQANSIYTTKGFEYISPHDAATGFTRFPDLDALDAVAKKLIEEHPKER